MSFPTETFAEHAAKRRDRAALKTGRSEINDLIRSKMPEHFTGAEVARAAAVADTGAKLAALDQGSRGAEHAPEVTDANSALRAMLRGQQESRGSRA